MGKRKRERDAPRQRGQGGRPHAAGEPAEAQPGRAADPRQEGRDGARRPRILAQAHRHATCGSAWKSAIANAENNHDLDVDDLVVAEAHVGKALVIKRFTPRGRGRVGRIFKPFSHLTIVVRQVEAQRRKEEESMGQKVNPIGLAARHQPHLGLALVRRQERVRHAAARGHGDPRGADEAAQAGGGVARS